MAVVLNGRTPSRLMDAVCKDLEKLFAGVKIEVEMQDRNKELRPIQIYKQSAPILMAGEDEQIQYPQIEVKLIHSHLGDQDEETGRIVYSCLIVFGICDYRMEADAWMQLMSMYERTYEHYREKPILENFEANQDIEFEMQSNDTYPFYFAVMSIRFMADNLERIDVEDMI